MGGDRAPGMVIQGADVALERDPHLDFILVGDEARIGPLLRRTRRLAKRSPQIVHTDKAVGAAEKPSAALRAGRGSSRSEEHTSELQSLMRISYAVFCLKKKKT